MEQELINSCQDDLRYFEARENKLKEFEKHLSDFDLPLEVEKRINLDITNEISYCETERNQILSDLDFDEKKEAKADLQNKYQDEIILEE